MYGQKAEAADLDEGDFALTFFTVGVYDGDFSVVLDPALPTQNVMNTWCHFIPFIVISKAEGERKVWVYIHIY